MGVTARFVVIVRQNYRGLQASALLFYFLLMPPRTKYPKSECVSALITETFGISTFEGALF